MLMLLDRTCFFSFDYLTCYLPWCEGCSNRCVRMNVHFFMFFVYHAGTSEPSQTSRLPQAPPDPVKKDGTGKSEATETVKQQENPADEKDSTTDRKITSSHTENLQPAGGNTSTTEKDPPTIDNNKENQQEQKTTNGSISNGEGLFSHNFCSFFILPHYPTIFTKNKWKIISIIIIL